MGRTTIAHTKEHVRIKQTLTNLPISAIVCVISQSSNYRCCFKAYFSPVASATCRSVSTNIMGSSTPSAPDIPGNHCVRTVSQSFRQSRGFAFYANTWQH